MGSRITRGSIGGGLLAPGLGSGLVSGADPVITIDMTGATLPPGVTLARTGAAMRMQTGTSVAAIVATDTPAREDRVGLGLLPWSHPPFVNTVEPFDHSVWTDAGSCAVSAPGGLVGPDGTTPADRLTDANAGAQCSRYKITGAGVWVHSGWYKYASAPTAHGGVLTYPAAPSPSSVIDFSTASVWTRYSGGNSSNIHGIHPAGLSKAGGHAFAETGAVDTWGSQTVQDVPHDVPLVCGESPYAAGASTGASTVAIPATGMIRDGIMDVEVAAMTYPVLRAGLPADSDLLSLDAPDGGAGIYYTASDGTWRVRAKGAAVGSVVAFMDGLPAGHVLEIRAVVDYAASVKLIRVRSGGVLEAATAEFSGSLTDTAMAAATAAYFGSRLGASRYFAGQPIRIRARPDGSSRAFAPEIMLIGDSTTASYQHRMNTGVGIYTVAQALSRPGIISLAVVGHTIAQQKTAHNASPYKGAASITGIRIRIGVNDVLAGTSAATIEAAIQDLVDTVAAGNPSALIMLSLMTPAGGYLSGPQKTVWQAVNAFIRAGSITGTDRVETAASDGSNDGADGLAADDNTDGIHPSNEGAIKWGLADRAGFQALGVLP